MGFWSKLFGGEKTEKEPETRAPEAAPAPGGGKKSPEAAFVEWCLAEIRKHPDVERAELGEGPSLPVSIWKRGSDGTHTMFLKNTFVETRELPPADKLAALKRLLINVERSGEKRDWHDVIDSFVPLLRAATFAASIRGDAPPTVTRPFVPFLSVFLGLDENERIGYTTQKELDEWGQSADTAFAHAFENMQRHVAATSANGTDVALYDEHAPYPIWHVVSNDSYETSRLVLPGYLASFRGKVAGNPIAIAPHRSLLVIAGDAEPHAIARLAHMAEKEFQASPRSVSPAVYTCDEAGHVVPLRLPPEHPQHQLVERGHYLLALDIYGEQKTELEERFQRQSVDVFVASFMLFENDLTKKLTSASTMTQGVPTLLPETDLIVLVSDSMEPLRVPRAVVLELLPECFAPAPEYFPPRLRVVGWPTPARLVELQRWATD
ncbi:MAG TPA: hypothetical protein VHB79_32730 [Polyangiaceae bacterium]|nr:hypothetical protein [Polyangiaceae bacterium]